MAKRGRPRKDEQWPLIETTPKNAKAIVKIATAYKEAQKERCHWGGEGGGGEGQAPRRRS